MRSLSRSTCRWRSFGESADLEAITASDLLSSGHDKYRPGYTFHPLRVHVSLRFGGHLGHNVECGGTVEARDAVRLLYRRVSLRVRHAPARHWVSLDVHAGHRAQAKDPPRLSAASARACGTCQSQDSDWLEPGVVPEHTEPKARPMTVDSFSHQCQATCASFHRAVREDRCLGAQKLPQIGSLADGEMWDDLVELSSVGRAVRERGPQPPSELCKGLRPIGTQAKHLLGEPCRPGEAIVEWSDGRGRLANATQSRRLDRVRPNEGEERSHVRRDPKRSHPVESVPWFSSATAGSASGISTIRPERTLSIRPS